MYAKLSLDNLYKKFWRDKQSIEWSAAVAQLFNPSSPGVGLLSSTRRRPAAPAPRRRPAPLAATPACPTREEDPGGVPERHLRYDHSLCRQASRPGHRRTRPRRTRCRRAHSPYWLPYHLRHRYGERFGKSRRRSLVLPIMEDLENSGTRVPIRSAMILVLLKNRRAAARRSPPRQF